MIPDDPPAGVPDWIITYGDMMSLLLTFFIMLVSMSEVKQNDKFQGVADSLHEHFGYDLSNASLAPGDLKPRNSSLSALALTGRSRRKNVMEGGSKEKSLQGEEPRVRIIRPGNRTTIGSVVYFEDLSAELSDEAKQDLTRLKEVLGGKPQKIEVRGHTSSKPLPPDQNLQDHWELSFRRAHNTMQFMVAELKIDPRRIRMSVAGPHEPVHTSPDPEKMRANPRVDVFLLEEVVSDLAGTPEEQAERMRKLAPPPPSEQPKL